ncbi:hypothetical protein [Streptomyces mirabilis]
MRREGIPDTAAASGLSTDDLAQPRDRSTPEGAGSRQAEVPTFPGESTNTSSEPAEGEAGGADLGPQDEAGTDSGTQRQATAPGARA